jgi:aryl-alcohol dehydrogenase-like predicted oxidoreductase
MMTYGTPAWRPWILPEEESRPFVQQALELGITFYDTADMYSRGVSEEILGRAVRDFGKRDDLIIATKVFFPMGDGPNDQGLSRKHILRSIENSLRRLGTDYVDLYQIHRWDYETPMEETLEALHDIIRSGKARYIGASSMYCYQFARSIYLADLRSWTRFVSMQNHYNLIYREEEREMIPFCRKEGIGLIPWSPMARGFLAGNRRKEDWGETVRAKTDDYGQKLYYQESDFQIADRVVQIASKYAVSPSQIALAWLLHQPGITAPIIGASKPHHLPEAVKALDIVLDESDRLYLEELYVPHAISGHR